MSRVVRPDGKEVAFGYDPIGRWISKTFQGKTTKYLWDGDTIIHEYWGREHQQILTKTIGGATVVTTKLKNAMNRKNCLFDFKGNTWM